MNKITKRLSILQENMNEILIESERLFLLTPKIKILKRRLKESNFHEKVLINGFNNTIFFPIDWPGDALEIYPFEIERRKENPDILPFWTYNIINKKTKTVVGDICCKTEPDEKNEIEIGYGINATQQGKGYATEAVLTLTSYIFSKTDVNIIKAESNESNIFSIKVLEKSGFKRIGNRFDTKDGNLIIWEKDKENL